MDFQIGIDGNLLNHKINEAYTHRVLVQLNVSVDDTIIDNCYRFEQKKNSFIIYDFRVESVSVDNRNDK